MKRLFLLSLLAALWAWPTATRAAATAAEPTSLPLPQTAAADRNSLRSEFMSYTIRATAASGDRNADWNYLPVEQFSTTTDSTGTHYSFSFVPPDFWTDRTILLHTEGSRNSHYVTVNGTLVGSARDSGVPSEFELHDCVRMNAANSVVITVPNDTDEPESAQADNRPALTGCFLYAQPHLRIRDYVMGTELNADGSGTLWADVIVENTSASTDSFALGFDVFSPQGKVEDFRSYPLSLNGGACDTVRIQMPIYGASSNLWSNTSPRLYTGNLFIRHGDRILEYVPFKTGFGTTTFADGHILRNGKLVSLRFARYDATTPDALRADIRRLKKAGYDTLWPHRPQPYWFYDICDAQGMYVIDQANIHTTYRTDDRRTGGTPSNDPAWLEEYMSRTQAMYYRSRNHVCIIARSLGEPSGNGYNFYKTYLWLRQADPDRPVIYTGAEGEWNSDLYITPEMAAQQ